MSTVRKRRRPAAGCPGGSQPSVAIVAERSNGYARGFIEGVVDFAEFHREWRFELLDPVAFASAKIDGYDNDLYGFVVKAYLEDGTLAWTSHVGYYDQLEGHVWQGDVTAMSGDISPWVASIPEPTSGLLLLIGVAGLALRRRRGEGER